MSVAAIRQCRQTAEHRIRSRNGTRYSMTQTKVFVGIAFHFRSRASASASSPIRTAGLSHRASPVSALNQKGRSLRPSILVSQFSPVSFRRNFSARSLDFSRAYSCRCRGRASGGGCVARRSQSSMARLSSSVLDLSISSMSNSSSIDASSSSLCCSANAWRASDGSFSSRKFSAYRSMGVNEALMAAVSTPTLFCHAANSFSIASSSFSADGVSFPFLLLGLDVPEVFFLPPDFFAPFGLFSSTPLPSS
mmetsp:Transcript_8013/g.14593  ORF Transcript_8013/g.14593 Transcript_8013/m.14593 type:complete len:250 (+) Transcript_8013:803-1552(+)